MIDDYIYYIQCNTITMLYLYYIEFLLLNQNKFRAFFGRTTTNNKYLIYICTYAYHMYCTKYSI